MIAALDDKDRIAIVVYAGSLGLVLPSTLVSQQAKILNSLDGLEAGGSTAGGAGIELAYKIAEENFLPEGNNRIILATDGDFNVGVSNSGELKRLIEKKRETGIYLTVVGFGMGNYKDDNFEALAQYGNGNYAYIDDIEEAEKFFVRELLSNLFAIAKDVKLQLEFNPRRVEACRLIGYDNCRLADEDFNDDTKDAGERGPGHSVTAFYEIIPAGQEAEETAFINSLRYQKPAKLIKKVGTKELLFLKLRYKELDSDSSKLMSQAVPHSSKKWKKTSDNFRFAASVAAFGLLLKDSPHKGSTDLDLVLTLANGAKGKDKEDYRKDFIKMVKQYGSNQPSAKVEEE